MIEHALHRFGQHLVQRRFVGCFPGAKAQGVFGKRERIALRLSGLVHDLLQLAERTVHLRQCISRVREAVIDKSRPRLRGADANRPVRRGRGRSWFSGVRDWQPAQHAPGQQERK